MGKVRAAVVLFVDIDDDKVSDSRDLAVLTQWGLHQAGFTLDKPMQVAFKNDILNVRIVNVMEAGMAAGNGYLWTDVTSKAFTERGIYTEAQQAQLDAEKEWENGS